MNKVASLKQSFMTSVVTLIVLSYMVTSAITVNFVITHLENDYKQDLIERASIIASSTKRFMKADDLSALNNNLKNLKVISHFNTVHVYHLVDGEVSSISSYDKDYTGNQSIKQIPPQIDRLEELSSPQIFKTIGEIIYPIADTDTEKLFGYLYIQMDMQRLNNLKNTIYICLGASFLFAITLALIIGVQIHKKIASSIGSITNTIQKVSRKKAFELRCEIQSHHEFEILARNINTMLTRTEKHVKKQVNAEKQILKLNHELEDKVSQRTVALKDSNEELLATLEKLHQFQGQLVESEKMASLGDMVAGVAHEVNTPIGLGVTASTLLSDRLEEIKVGFENKTLKSSQLKKFLYDGEENIGIIYRNLSRAADLISSFKKVAVDQSSEEDREFAVAELIDEVILTLRPQLKSNAVTLDIDCPQNLMVTSKPGPINQILINLILNSLIHAFENTEKGTISINVMILSGQLHIQYKDNGKGVDTTIRKRIFDPFITTKRGEGGSGLGLHLVYNLVTQALKGNIQFDSDLGNGVCFDIIFPVIIHQKPAELDDSETF